MLTKTDLKAIQGLVRSEIRAEVDPLKNGITELKSDVSELSKDMKIVKRSLKKVEKTVDVMIDMFNKDDMRLLKRVKRIEDSLGIPAV